MLLYRYFLIVYSAIIFLLCVAGLMQINLPAFTYTYILLVNIYMVLCSRHNTMMFIISFILLISDYSIIYANYSGLINDFFTTRHSQSSFVKSLNVLALFQLFLFAFVKWKKIQPRPQSSIFVSPNNKNRWIIYSLLLLLIPIFLFGYVRPEEGDRGTSSPIYEYSAILFIMFFYYCGDKWAYKLTGLLLVGLFSLQSFVFGGRVEAIQFIIVAFLMVFMHKTSMTKVVVAMTVMFFVLTVVGAVRGELLSGNYEISEIILSVVKRGFVFDTAYAAYYASESFVYIIDKYSLIDRIGLFWEFVKSIFIGSDPEFDLSEVSQKYVDHYYGGITPFYFYFYLGILGILLISLIVACYINNIVGLSEKTSEYVKLLSVWIACSVFRWYMYYPGPLFRGVLFMSIVYFVLQYFNRFTRSLFADR